MISRILRTQDTINNTDIMIATIIKANVHSLSRKEAVLLEDFISVGDAVGEVVDKTVNAESASELIKSDTVIPLKPPPTLS